MSINNNYNKQTGAKHEKEINSYQCQFTPEEKIDLRNIFDDRDEKLQEAKTYAENNVTNSVRVNAEVKKQRGTQGLKQNLAEGPKPPNGVVVPSKNAALRAKAQNVINAQNQAKQEAIQNEAQSKVRPIVQQARQEGRHNPPSQENNHNHQNSHDHNIKHLTNTDLRGNAITQHQAPHQH